MGEWRRDRCLDPGVECERGKWLKGMSSGGGVVDEARGGGGDRWNGREGFWTVRCLYTLMNRICNEFNNKNG